MSSVFSVALRSQPVTARYPAGEHNSESYRGAVPSKASSHARSEGKSCGEVDGAVRVDPRSPPALLSAPFPRSPRGLCVQPGLLQSGRWLCAVAVRLRTEQRSVRVPRSGFLLIEQRSRCGSWAVSGHGEAVSGLPDWLRSQQFLSQINSFVSVRLLTLVCLCGACAGVHQTLFGLPKGGPDRCPAAGLRPVLAASHPQVRLHEQPSWSCDRIDLWVLQ